MNGAGLTLTYTDAPLRHALVNLAEFGGERQHKLLDALGAYNESATRLRFVKSVDPAGNPWKPSQRVLKHGGRTLVKSRRGLDSITHNVMPDNSGVEWGTNVGYMGAHQRGATIQREAHHQSIFQRVGRDGQINSRFVTRKNSNFERRVHVGAYTINLPARPFLGVNTADVAEMETIGERHLAAAAAPTGVPTGGK